MPKFKYENRTTKLRLISAVALGLLFAGSAYADPISTFKKTCFAHIGDKDAIAQSAKKLGFTRSELSDVFGGYMGQNKRLDQTIQVNIATKNKFECAVTTSDAPNPEILRVNFFESVGLSSNKSTAKARINGKRYTFKFDSNGGEAFVVFAK